MKRRAVMTSLFACAALILLVGCRNNHPGRFSASQRSGWFANRATTSADITPVPEIPVSEVAYERNAEADFGVTPGTDGEAGSVSSTDRGNAFDRDVAAGDLQAPKPRRRLHVPEELPGANSQPITLPPLDASASFADRRSITDKLFPEVTLPAESDDRLSESTPLTLAALQQMATTYSPVIRRAAADVENARGLAVQAGLYPNPLSGYQGDTIGTGRTAGYNGIFLSQEFVTAGKLTLAQNAAFNEVRATQAELRKSRIQLASEVRRNYFRVLIGQEQLRFNKALAQLSNEVYRAQVDLVSGGESAPYEPLQLRVFAIQARNAVIQSTNTRDAAWRQLAAAVGIPDLSRQSVAGSAEMPIPDVSYESLALTLQQHSDLTAANARISGAAWNLRLQEKTPIPNVTFSAALFHDDTTPDSDVAANLQISAPVPVFNRNQGNITSAHAGVVRSRQELIHVNNSLMADLAEIYSQYTSNRMISMSYRADLLPDQLRVYRGVYDRFQIEGQSGDFAQVVVAQQTLSQVVTGYLQSLSDAWMATVDLAELVQIDDLMTMDGMSIEQLSR